MAKPILAIDQGTTSSRAILFSASGRPEHVAQQEFAQHFPNDGWVEHDGEEIWSSTLAVCREVLEKAGISASQARRPLSCWWPLKAFSAGQLRSWLSTSVRSVVSVAVACRDTVIGTPLSFNVLQNRAVGGA